MSTDRTQDEQVNQDRTPVEIKSATGITSAAETEISDETLEAVAGGQSPDSYNVTPSDRLHGISTELGRTSLSSHTH